MLQLERSSSSNVLFASRQAARKEKDREPRKIVPGAPPGTAAVGCASMSNVTCCRNHGGTRSCPKGADPAGKAICPMAGAGSLGSLSSAIRRRTAKTNSESSHLGSLTAWECGFVLSAPLAHFPQFGFLDDGPCFFAAFPAKTCFATVWDLVFQHPKRPKDQVLVSRNLERAMKARALSTSLSGDRCLMAERDLAVQRQRPGDSWPAWPEEEEGGPFRSTHVTRGWVAVPGEREAPDPEPGAKQLSRMMQKMHLRPD